MFIDKKMMFIIKKCARACIYKKKVVPLHAICVFGI